VNSAIDKEVNQPSEANLINFIANGEGGWDCDECL
jgi:hypothetical protein